MTLEQDHSSHCKNCGNHFEGKYCNLCGQKAITNRIDWRFVLHHIEHSVFHLDKGLLFTIRELFTRPGLAVRDYIAGKRVKYTSPLAYVVLTTIASFLLVKLLNTDGPIAFESVQDKNFVNFIVHHNDQIAVIILIPLSAFLTKALFPRIHYNFFEVFAFHCFIRGQFMIVGMIVVLLDWFLVQMGIFLHPITILVLQVVPNIFLMGWGLQQFIGGKKFLHYLLFALIIMAMLAAAGALMAIVAARTLYSGAQ